MAGHYVTCVYCKKKFNRDNTPTIQVSARRYAHKECAEQIKSGELTIEKTDLEKLEEYIMKLFNEPYISAKIKKQIKSYVQEYNYTYNGMLKSLIWWFEIKGNSIEKANNGIGIIPYIYQDAKQYYYNIYLAQLANENKNIETYQIDEKEISIKSPRAKIKKVKLFSIEEGE